MLAMSKQTKHNPSVSCTSFPKRWSCTAVLPFALNTQTLPQNLAICFTVQLQHMLHCSQVAKASVGDVTASLKTH